MALTTERGGFIKQRNISGLLYVDTKCGQYNTIPPYYSQCSGHADGRQCAVYLYEIARKPC